MRQYNLLTSHTHVQIQVVYNAVLVVHAARPWTISYQNFIAKARILYMSNLLTLTYTWPKAENANNTGPICIYDYSLFSIYVWARSWPLRADVTYVTFVTSCLIGWTLLGHWWTLELVITVFADVLKTNGDSPPADGTCIFPFAINGF